MHPLLRNEDVSLLFEGLRTLLAQRGYQPRMTRCSLLFVLLGATVLFGPGCSSRGPAVEVADVTQPCVLTLLAPPDSPYVHGLSVRIRGHLDGIATISLTNFPVQKLTGDFDVKIGGDWYTTNCVLNYSPQDVRAGKVKIEYYFSNIEL